MTNNGPQMGDSRPPKRITFGQLAIRKGYVSSQQVEEALGIQVSLNERDGKHKLIGLIMLEMGVLGTTELIDVLKDMEDKDAVTNVMRPAARAISKHREPRR